MSIVEANKSNEKNETPAVAAAQKYAEDIGMVCPISLEPLIKDELVVLASDGHFYAQDTWKKFVSVYNAAATKQNHMVGPTGVPLVSNHWKLIYSTFGTKTMIYSNFGTPADATKTNEKYKYEYKYDPITSFHIKCEICRKPFEMSSNDTPSYLCPKYKNGNFKLATSSALSFLVGHASCINRLLTETWEKHIYMNSFDSMYHNAPQSRCLLETDLSETFSVVKLRLFSTTKNAITVQLLKRSAFSIFNASKLTDKKTIHDQIIGSNHVYSLHKFETSDVFENYSYEKCVFYGWNLEGLEFRNCLFRNVDFVEWETWINVQFKSCRFINCQFKPINGNDFPGSCLMLWSINCEFVRVSVTGSKDQARMFSEKLIGLVADEKERILKDFNVYHVVELPCFIANIRNNGLLFQPFQESIVIDDDALVDGDTTVNVDDDDEDGHNREADNNDDET